MRLAGLRELEIYEPDPKLYWRLKPNQDCYTKIDRKPVHINSQGTRGPEFHRAKPPGTFRILSLGDSRTFGWGLTEAEDLLGLIERDASANTGQPAESRSSTPASTPGPIRRCTSTSATTA